MSKLGIYKINSEAVTPKKATDGSACFDICACLSPTELITVIRSDNSQKKLSCGPTQEFLIFPDQRVLIPTGLILDIPEGFSVRLHPRSGLALKSGIVLANCEGVIDSDYVEPLFVMLLNISGMVHTIKHGDRICQAELVKTEIHDIVELSSRPEIKTNRNGGFGSTGS